MNKKINSEEQSSKDPRIINHELSAFHFVIWLGASFRYLANFGSKSFNTFYKPESDKLNFIIGFFIQLVVIIIAIGTLLYYSSMSVN